MEQEHRKYMDRCLQLGAEAKAQGNPPVGSLVVKNGVIIGEGIEGANSLPRPLAHAEILAILAAIEHTGSNDLSSCTLYTSVEPCFMCSYLIRQTKINEVIFQATTPEIGGVSSEFPILTATSIRKWNPPPTVKTFKV